VFEVGNGPVGPEDKRPLWGIRERASENPPFNPKRASCRSPKEKRALSIAGKNGRRLVPWPSDGPNRLDQIKSAWSPGRDAMTAGGTWLSRGLHSSEPPFETLGNKGPYTWDRG